jgi:hypothetical protein
MLLLATMLLAGTHAVAGVLASRCCSMMSLLLLVLVLPVPEKSFGLKIETFYIYHARKAFRSTERDILHSPMPEKSGPWRMTWSHPREWKTFSAMYQCNKNSEGGRKNDSVSTEGFPSLVMQFSDGKH